MNFQRAPAPGPLPGLSERGVTFDRSAGRERRWKLPSVEASRAPGDQLPIELDRTEAERGGETRADPRLPSLAPAERLRLSACVDDIGKTLAHGRAHHDTLLHEHDQCAGFSRLRVTEYGMIDTFEQHLPAPRVFGKDPVSKAPGQFGDGASRSGLRGLARIDPICERDQSPMRVPQHAETVVARVVAGSL